MSDDITPEFVEIADRAALITALAAARREIKKLYLDREDLERQEYESHQRVERLEAALVDLDDTLCEIVSGDQGSFKPHPGTISMGKLALGKLRAALPIKDRVNATIEASIANASRRAATTDPRSIASAKAITERLHAKGVDTRVTRKLNAPIEEGNVRCKCGHWAYGEHYDTGGPCLECECDGLEVASQP